MKAAIIYYTKTGHTLEAAEAVAMGIRAEGGSVDIIPCDAVQGDVLAGYDILLFGSPCWMGKQSRTGISGPMKKLLGSLKAETIRGKICGGFAVQGGLGADRTVMSIGKILASKGCTHYHEGPYASAGAPLSLWKGPAVKEHDLERFRAFGRTLYTAWTEQRVRP